MSIWVHYYGLCQVTGEKPTMYVKIFVSMFCLNNIPQELEIFTSPSIGSIEKWPTAKNQNGIFLIFAMLWLCKQSEFLHQGSLDLKEKCQSLKIWIAFRFCCFDWCIPLETNDTLHKLSNFPAAGLSCCSCCAVLCRVIADPIWAWAQASLVISQ